MIKRVLTQKKRERPHVRSRGKVNKTHSNQPKNNSKNTANVKSNLLDRHRVAVACIREEERSLVGILMLYSEMMPGCRTSCHFVRALAITVGVMRTLSNLRRIEKNKEMKIVNKLDGKNVNLRRP